MAMSVLLLDRRDDLRQRLQRPGVRLKQERLGGA